MTSIIMILAAFVCACMAETPTASGSEIGYAMESFAGSSYPELVQSIAECAADDDCDFEAALAAYPIPDAEYVESLDAEYVESLFPAIDEEGEVPAFEGEVPAFEDLQVPAFEDLQVPAFEEGEMPAFGEAVDSAEDSADGRRQLAGLPDRYGWANGRTYRCANEGGWCPCFGNVVYTKKCSGTFSCNQAGWGRVVANRWNSNHRSNVRGFIPCNNGAFGGDPFPGHDKQCFCHPRQEQPTQYDYVQKWTERRCNQQCGSPGAGWFSSDWWKGVMCGFSCTGACPIQAAAFAAGREHTFPIESCAEHCYCVFKGWTA